MATPPLIHEHPSASLYDAAQRLIQTHARRLPLLDNDSETGHQVIVSVLTQYRLLKFIAINVKYRLPNLPCFRSPLSQCTRDILFLHLPLRKLGIGTYVQRDPSEGELQPGQNPYHPIATATLNTTVFDVVHMFSERGISAVPIIDENGVVVNLYETVDVIVRDCVTFARLDPFKWPFRSDSSSSRGLSSFRPDDRGGPQSTLA